MHKLLLGGIGLGTFPFANVFTPVDETEAAKIVHTYLEMGGKYIETAPIYGQGEVETLLGKLLQEIPRADYYVSSKCGYIWNDKKQNARSGKHGDVIAECEKSLRRLKLDHIDLYMSHIPDLVTPFEETVGAMVDLQEQGKVRSIGVSNVTLKQLKEYNRYGRIKYVQNRFSLLNQSFDRDFVAYCQENDIGLIPYQVIERGLLTEKAVVGIKLRDGDFRRSKPEFADNIRHIIGKSVGEYLKPIAVDLQTSVSALAIWWAMQQPAIALCVLGATKVEQVVENFRAKELSLPEGTLERINSSYEAMVQVIEQECGQPVSELLRGVA